MVPSWSRIHGFQLVREAGIQVEVGTGGDAAQELLEELQATLRNQLLEAGGRLA